MYSSKMVMEYSLLCISLISSYVSTNKALKVFRCKLERLQSCDHNLWNIQNSYVFVQFF